ncbi:hypothetical protein Tco_0594684 [Tanacetum coccineum]
MGEPTTKGYISATCKSFISNDTNGKMIEKNFIEIEGTFLLKIRDNTFHKNDGEDVFKHINSFLEVVEPLKIRGLSHDRFRLSVFPTSLSGSAKEWFTNECTGTIFTWDDLVENFVLKFYDLCEHDEEEETNDDNNPDIIENIPENFKIDNDLFHFDSPLCIAFEEFNHLLKINPDLFTYDIQGFMTYDQYAQELNNKTQGDGEPWSENSWYDKLADGKLKDETLAFKAKTEESWGDATPGEVSPFAHIETFRRGPYANIMNEWGYNHHLGTNHTSERNHETSNVGCDQEHKDDPTPDPSNCKCAGDVVDFKTLPGISLETSILSTMDLDGVTCLTVIMKSIVKKKQKGAILELKRRHLKKVSKLHQYAVSNKEDTAYLRQLITRTRIKSIPNPAYPLLLNTPYAQLFH